MPFKFRLTIWVSALVVVALVGGFATTQRVLEGRFSERIRQELERTGVIVTDVMDARSRRLDQVAQILQKETLIVEGLRSYDLDRATWDNTLREELIEARFQELDALVLLDEDGAVVGIGNRVVTAQDVAALFDDFIYFDEVLETDRLVTGDVLKDAGKPLAMQWVGRAVLDVDVVLGAVFVGKVIDSEFVSRVKFLSGVDLVFVDPLNHQPIIATDLEWIAADQPMAVLEARLNDALSGTGVQRWQFNHDRVLCLANEGDALARERYHSKHVGSLPPYLLMKSLDAETHFVRAIRNASILIGGIAIAISIVLGFFLSRGISKPIDQLQAATQEIVRSNFAARVEVKSNDEFQRLAEAFNNMARGLQERERIRGAMNKVVSKEIADELLKGDIQLGGEERIATVLFSDIRGFTSLAEGMAPEALLDLLNAYFTRASACVDRHHGLIDKYIGDAVMALFGVPVTRAQPALDAVLAARDMVTELDLFNREYAQPLGKLIRIGVGINTGSVVAGNVGSDQRLNYTVLGDEVNLASRLEGLTVKYGVALIASQSTIQALPPNCGLRGRRLDRVQVKGKSEGVNIYDVWDVGVQEALIQDYETALDQLLKRDVQAALAGFGMLVERFPNDPASRVMLDRCEQFVLKPEQYDLEIRDGSYVFNSK